MRPRAKEFRRKPKCPHVITVKQCGNSRYLVQCSCGETVGEALDRSMGRRVGREHIRQVAPHLAGPLI